MRIQHNIMAMNAYRNYSSNTSALSKNLEKLSSGYKINRAGDDAAGLAISEKMRAQITGLETAQKNAKDGISLVQTAEGALTEVHDMLNRMVELADQSANGTYDDTTDRDNLQKEFDALRSEIDRISKATNFNGIELLNGKQEAGRDMTEYSDVGIAAVGSTRGSDTIIHSNGVSAAKTSFGVDLHDVAFEAATGDQIKITIGSGSTATQMIATLAASQIATDGTPLSAADVVNAMKTKYTGTSASTTLKIGGQDFVVGGNGTRLTFTQKNVPTAASEVVSANQKVSISAISSHATASIGGAAAATNLLVSAYATGTMGGTASAADILGGIATAVASAATATLTAAAKTAIDALQVTGSTAQKISMKRFASGAHNGQIGLYVGNQLIGVAAASGITAGAGTKTLAFKGLTSSGAVGTTAIGNVKITVKAGQTLAATGISATTAHDTGLTFTPGSNKYLTNVSAGATATKAKLLALAQAKGATGTSVKIGVASGGKYQLLVGDTVVAEATASGGGTITFKDGTATGANTVFTATAKGTAAPAVGTKVNTGITYNAAGTVTSKGDWNVSTTVDVQGTQAQAGRLASTKFTLDADKIVDGGSIRIGDKTYTFALGSDSKVAAGSNVINLRDLSALASDAATAAKNAFLDEVGTRLSEKADSNSVFTVGHQGNGVITVVERVENAAATDGVKLDKEEKINAQLSYGGVKQTGSGLTLQIGDTSDPFNQITVGINSMDCKSLGIDDSQINISKQSDAQAAVKVIKAAINSVSSTRGDLGALQNRLEHTINNLSVMTENIQDAEASIRDVDVAKEMMDYTKNNILVQSAQAMLAQANQVPQGVLQLLQ